MMTPFLKEAEAIGDRFTQTAIWSGDRCTWVSRDLQEIKDPLGRGPIVRSMEAGVYAGLGGVAYFLANLAKQTHNEEHAQAARGAALQAAWNLGWRSPNGPSKPGGHAGFYSGGLGVAWALSEVDRLVGSDDCHQLAGAALDRFATTRPIPTQAKDLLGGGAGAILACIALATRTESDLIGYAEHLGDDLLSFMVTGDGWKAWPHLSEKGQRVQPLTGLSHGAAGYTYALANLAEVTGRDEYATAAYEGFHYEAAHKMPDGRNWIDLRETDTPRVGPGGMIAWCHGAPGIGMQRAHLRGFLPEAERASDLAMASETTKGSIEEKAGIPDWSFTYCHGLSGLLDCWMEMTPGAPERLSFARELTLKRISIYGESVERDSRWSANVDWPMFRPGYADLSLLKGLAGIGHFMLRLHDPSRVPTILLGPPLGALKPTSPRLTAGGGPTQEGPIPA